MSASSATPTPGPSPILAPTRLAGVIYLLLVLTGIFSLIYVPSQIYASGDPARMLAQIADQRLLMALGICVGLIAQLLFLSLPVVLYGDLARHGRIGARLMVVFVVASLPLSFSAIGQQIAMLDLATGADPSDPALQAALTNLVDAQYRATGLATIFWGLWLFPLGWLGGRSGLLPWPLAALLMLGCVGYLVDFAGPLLVDGYRDSLVHTLAGKPSSLGEIGTCLWLLIRGAPSSWARQNG